MQSRAADRQHLHLAVIAGCVAIAVVSSVSLIALGYPGEFAIIRIAAYSVSFLVAGSIAWIRRPDNPVGPVMLATSVLGSLTFFAAYPNEIVGRLAGVCGSLTNVLGIWFILAAPSGRFTAETSRWLIVAFSMVLVVGNISRDLTSLRIAFACGLVISLLLAGAVLQRWRLARGPSRRALTPVVAAGLVICIVHGVDFGAGVLSLPITRGSPVFWGSIISRMLVPFGFLVGLLWLRMARSGVADLMVDLADTSHPGRLRDALADALGDPSIAVLMWSPAATGYVAPDGTAVDPEAVGSGRAVMYLKRGSDPLAAIVHDPALAEDPGLVAAVAATVRLAINNERLTAEVESQLAEVQASRGRIVAAGDAERRRIERDLHDGAQQRLVSMSLALHLARAKLGADADPEIRLTLDRASTDAKAALSELRELARGIHPQILTQAGLGPAVESLVSRSPLDVTVEMPADRYVPAVESTGYFVVSEALTNIAKYAHAGRAAVRGTWRDDVLTIEVTDDGIGGADPASGSGLRGLVDRLSAINGTLEVTSPTGGGTRVLARIPAVVPLPMPR